MKEAAVLLLRGIAMCKFSILRLVNGQKIGALLVGGGYGVMGLFREVG